MTQNLFERAKNRVALFCHLNGVPVPEYEVVARKDWMFLVCAYYRPSTITICLDKCAQPCTALQHRQWSWPGNTTDRTPYGVVAHEFGHHVDWSTGSIKGRYSSEFSHDLREQSGEAAISGYCPNDAEWFAEMFRLFITNPCLLQELRPVTYGLFTHEWTPIESKGWREELDGAPLRVIHAVENKL